jgi:hypothetical protein
MNIKFLLVFFVSTLSYAQITLNDMKTIIKMDSDSFETFAMNRGYVFSRFCDGELKCVVYTKGLGDKTKFITLYTKYYGIDDNSFTYQTSSEIEYLSIKKQMKEQGFVLFDTVEWQEKGVLFKYYKNRNYKLTIGVGKNEINTVDYEISLDFL